jgi:hypothetical protein
MDKLLSFLDGKKTTIATILGAILTFVVGREYIQPDVANLVSVILIALGLGANVANYQSRLAGKK